MAKHRRRTFIISATFCLVFPFVLKPLSVMAGDPGRRLAAVIRRRRILALFDDAGAAQAIGRQYLEAHPDEADGDRILLELESGARAAHPIRRLRDVIDRARDQDFRRGATVVVGGWVMARTEARVCALTVLL